MAADETRCDVKDRLDSTELIPWQSGKDTVAQVDPCNDELNYKLSRQSICFLSICYVDFIGA